MGNEKEMVLQLRDNAALQLAKIKTVETGVEYLNKVKAMEVWVKAERKDSKLQNMVSAQKIRVQRIIGKLIKDGQDRGEIAQKGDYKEWKKSEYTQEEHSKPQTLSEIGLSAKQSSTFKAIASIPEEKFEMILSEAAEEIAEEAENITLELTTAAMVRIARKDERAILKESLSAQPLPEDKYRVFYADPPFRNYLEELVANRIVSSEIRDTAWRVWEKLQTDLIVNLPEPDAASGADGSLMLAFDDGLYHLEFEIIKNGYSEVFFLQRDTNYIWETEFNVGSSLSEALLDKVRLFLN